MRAHIAIYDETTVGDRSVALMLDVPSDRITVKELIRMRVFEEVDAYNKKQQPVFSGLVQPTETEKTLNGFKFRKPKQVDPGKQYSAAIEAFKANRIIVLVDDLQVEDLDEVIDIDDSTTVSFLKLVPLVGG